MSTDPPGARTPGPGDVLAELNVRQRAAVTHDGGPLVVLAGPGSGKTRVIVHRVARLVAPPDRGGLGVEPDRVLALAFTIKSARQLSERLTELVGPALASRVRASTCHAFGRRIVARFGDVLGLPPTWRIVDTAERKRLMRAVAREHGLFEGEAARGRDWAIERAMGFIDRCRNDDVTPARAEEWIKRSPEERLRARGETIDEQSIEGEVARAERYRDMVRLFVLSEPRRLREGLLALDDYITLPLEILRRSDRVAAIVRDELRHIVVDEFQDWNPAQIALLRELAPRADADVCVVGDDDQSIYAFRGADDRAFERFARLWPDHRVVKLERNYRSGASIIDAANAIIEKADDRFAPDKVIEADPDNADAGLVEGVTVPSDNQLGAAIAAMIRQERAESRREWTDYAVIASTHTTIDRIIAEFELQGIPVAARRRPTPLSDAGVQDLLAWLRLIVDPRERAYARRLLARPPLSTPVELIKRWEDDFAAAQKDGEDRPYAEWLADNPDERARSFATSLSALRRVAVSATADELVTTIVHDCHIVPHAALSLRDRAERITNVVRVMQFVRAVTPRLDPPGDVGAFLRHYDDLSEDEQAFQTRGDERVEGGDDDEKSAEGVRVMTAHQAKGLEFDTVFLARVRPGRDYGFPMTGSSSDDEADEALPEDLSGRRPHERSAEQRRLFYVACTRAERRLVLVAKSKKHQRTTSIDYFLELQQRPGDAAMPVSDGARFLDGADIAPNADDDEEIEPAGAQTGREALLRRFTGRVRVEAAAALAEADRPGLSSEALGEIARRLSASARKLALLAHLRANAEPPEFVEDSGDHRAALLDLVDRVARNEPPERLTRPLRAPLRLSYSKLSDYAWCPRCFYVKYELGLDEPKTAELTVGNAVHGALEAFYRERRDAEGDGLPPPGRDRLLALGELALKRDWPRHHPLDDDALRRVRAQLDLVLSTLHHDGAEILEIEENVDIPYTVDAAEHRLTGKIDRIDRLPDGGFRIIDYKTGKPSKRLLEPKADDLQLCIYTMALQRRFEIEGTPRGVAEYWVLSTGERGAIDFGALRLDRARAKIDKAVRGMLAGDFNKGKDCKGLCDLLGPTD